MVVDPLAALGLAGNICQFLDCSWKLIKNTRTIYHSATGTLEENATLEIVTNDLCGNIQRMAISYQGTDSAGNAFRSLALNAQQTAQDLLNILETIKVKHPRSKRDSFLASWSAFRARGQIQALTGKLDHLQRQLMFYLLSSLR